MKNKNDFLQKELLTLQRKVTKLEEQLCRQENNADSERSLLKRVNEQLREEIQIRKRAEQSLKESEHRFRTLFEKIPDAIIVANIEGNILDVNPATCNHLGYSREELLCMHINDIDQQSVRYNRKETQLPWLLRNFQLNFETAQIHKKGYEIPVELNIIMMDISDEPATLAIARDISNRKENEKTINKLVDRLSAIFNQSIDGILVADLETKELLFCNQAFTKFTGYSLLEIITMDILDIHPQHIWKDVIKSFKSVMFNQAVYHQETEIMHKNGSIIYADISGGFAFIDDRPCSVGIFRDVTERKKLEEMKIDVERIIRQDLKAPLNSINTIAQTLLMEKMHHSQLDRVYEIHSIGSRLLKLIDLHNELQNMELGTYTPDFEWFDFRVIFKNIELLVSQEAEIKLVRIIHHDSQSPNLGKLLYFGEPTLLESMLVNLILNAVEASPNFSEVTLSYEQNSAHIVISVHNFGMIPSEVQKRFFEKYATHGKPKGTGLGTYSARLIAQAHGGKIFFQTDSAMGTTVTVILPFPEMPDKAVRNGNLSQKNN